MYLCGEVYVIIMGLYVDKDSLSIIVVLYIFFFSCLIRDCI